MKREVPKSRTLWLNLALFVAYVITARLGLKIGAVSSFAALVWPPTGISLAALFLFGKDLWPGIAAAAFVANISVGSTIPMAIAMSVGNTLEAVVGASLLRHLGFHPSLKRLRWVASLILVAALSALISSLIGVTAMFFGGKLTETYGAAWLAWWFGDVMGDLVIAPMLLLIGAGVRLPKEKGRLVEVIGLLAIVTLTGLFFFTDFIGPGQLVPLPRPYFAFPILMLVAIRLGPPGTIAAVFLTSIIVIGGTVSGHGRFWIGSLSQSLLEAQVFLAILATSKMVLAAATSERNESTSERLKSEAQLQLIANTLSAFVTYIDPEERYRFANDSYLQWIGKTREQVLGKTAREILGDDVYLKTRPNMLRALGGEPVSYDLQWKNSDGLEKIFRIDYRPDIADDGAVSGYVMHGQDVSDLRKAISARDEFLSIASHELKTPLTSLSLHAEMRKRSIEKGMWDAFSHERLSKLVADDEKQITRLTRLVDDMLDVSRLSADKFQLDLEKFDLCAFVREVVERLEPQFQNARIEINVDACSEINGHWDRHRIEQIIINLLTNAMKYGNGKPVFLRVTERGRAVRLVVTDQGIGIADKDKERIFKPFERAVSPTGVSGLGLGLYIVRKLVEAHGGKVSVESEIGKGSTLIVDLPVH